MKMVEACVAANGIATLVGVLQRASVPAAAVEHSYVVLAAMASKAGKGPSGHSKQTKAAIRNHAAAIRHSQAAYPGHKGVQTQAKGLLQRLGLGQLEQPTTTTSG